MATSEIYVRVRVEDGASRFRVQQRLSGVAGYIGSYVVENEKVGEGDFDPFDIAVGYNIPDERVAATMEAIRGTTGVAGARGMRNRNPVTPLILFPFDDGQES
jgi:hypothetical protein